MNKIHGLSLEQQQQQQQQQRIVEEREKDGKKFNRATATAMREVREKEKDSMTSCNKK
jgi:CHASE3 domain sensor protein